MARVGTLWPLLRYGHRHKSTPNNSALYQPSGAVRGADQVSADAIWSISPATIANFHFSWNDLTDAYRSRELGTGGWAQFWPNNNFYSNYQANSTGVPIYYPNLNIGGNSFGGPNFFWNQIPAAESFSSSIYAHLRFPLHQGWLRLEAQRRQHAGDRVFPASSSNPA